MEELKFLGIGSAFNTKLGNTSVFIKESNTLFLIDCGGTVFSKLQELKILEGVNKVYIAITHTHPDHVGSLGDIIFYSYYNLKATVTILFPEKKLINNFLNCIGVNEKMYHLYSKDKIDINDEELIIKKVEFIVASHSGSIPAYGLLLSFNNKKIYYSGDNNKISDSVVEQLTSGGIHRVYQDTCGLDYEGNGHLSLKKLCDKIPMEYRGKVYCMHLDKNIEIKEINKNGFNVCEIFK
ncbi:MBL fold metallo-hydrolase [Clostridium chromiireducens]|uniref:MBL fold metallo-hydrolase n=1 Tax=Clostridium chromiireducens TaxID=225345 RepID=A0A964RNR2_9CLOT|nr:MBL fold metallo-hydrolase [Clostridium chromiireducens]